MTATICPQCLAIVDDPALAPIELDEAPAAPSDEAAAHFRLTPTGLGLDEALALPELPS